MTEFTLKNTVPDFELLDPQLFAAFILRVPGGVSLDVYRARKHRRYVRPREFICRMCLYGEHLACEASECGCTCRP